MENQERKKMKKTTSGKHSHIGISNVAVYSRCFFLRDHEKIY